MYFLRKLGNNEQNISKLFLIMSRLILCKDNITDKYFDDPNNKNIKLDKKEFEINKNNISDRINNFNNNDNFREIFNFSQENDLKNIKNEISPELKN